MKTQTKHDKEPKEKEQEKSDKDAYEKVDGRRRIFWFDANNARVDLGWRLEIVLSDLSSQVVARGIFETQTGTNQTQNN